MANTLPPQGVINVISPGDLDRKLREEAEARVQSTESQQSAGYINSLSAYIERQHDAMQRHRDSQSGWNTRLTDALLSFNGQYTASKLAQIKQFGGSEVFARIVAGKCRSASSLLRDIYLTQDKPWGIEPPADPDIPPEVVMQIQSLAMSEAAYLQQNGQQVPETLVSDRVKGLMAAAKKAEREQARKRAKDAEGQIQELLVKGGFYNAFGEFLVDLPLFPFACLKGPVVKMAPEVKYVQGVPQSVSEPRMYWNRVSPFDVWWTPGVSRIEDADIIERLMFTRRDLNDLLDLPGYDSEAIQAVLRDYAHGYYATNESTDTTRAVLENRETPFWNDSGLIECLEFHGSVQGTMLIEWGLRDVEVIQAPNRDFLVQAWKIGRYVIKVQLTPSPRQRHPYFITSFEKVPGTPVGNAIPDILGDIEDMANATLRSLVNNLSISSGPQVVINTDRMAPGEDAQQLYPWKRWLMTSDPMSNNQQDPVSFFQPDSNAQELIGVYNSLNNYADDLSAIPKYMQGGAAGGAGRTASGLAMLMGNASKLLQMVAANIDNDVIAPLLTGLYDLIMLTDETGVLKGDENIRVLGVNVAIQRETERVRQLEFLQITANPIDTEIMGVSGRANVLRSVSGTIGLDGVRIVPDEDEMATIQQQDMVNKANQAQGDQPPRPNNDTGPRNRLAGGVG